jgi:hypothetical protein
VTASHRVGGVRVAHNDQPQNYVADMGVLRDSRSRKTCADFPMWIELERVDKERKAEDSPSK